MNLNTLNTSFKIPGYIKVIIIFIGLVTLVTILSITKSIIVPFIYSTVIAILLSPIVKFLVNKNMHRAIAISLVLVIVSVTIILFFAILSSQLDDFINAFPVLVDKFYILLNSSILWISDNCNISTEKIHQYIADAKLDLLTKSRSAIALTLTSVGDIMVVLFLIPVYVFMILFYQNHLMEFIHQIFGKNNHAEVNEVISSSKKIIQKYLLALLLEAGIIAVLNSLGLFILGMEYAILLGILGALLNIIPYLGGVIGIVIYMMVAIVTKDSYAYAIYAFLVYTFIQILDNNIILPLLIGSKVKINPLISFIAVILGGAIWGIAGMFISLPIVAILKIVFDHIDSLKPWGFLLGGANPIKSTSKLKIKLKLTNK